MSKKIILRLVSFVPIFSILMFAVYNNQISNPTLLPIITFWGIVPLGAFIFTSDEF
ncbi:hypothetical protein ACOTWR_06360 [Aliarcobacter butzleri]|uniref:hypothetical protein n=1 Tax=Aliarcobacter butzleri TaxID=28197 RepID=UPI0021B40C3F|nr:hypothetical protein [Aliarcobacter butzleri]MCT7563199.1 hypothetical protein [Aliarcobacter butzleri]MCT7578674.1 hypothetical protein [Aliarcobacter butzleri]